MFDHALPLNSNQKLKLNLQKPSENSRDDILMIKTSQIRIQKEKKSLQSRQTKEFKKGCQKVQKPEDSDPRRKTLSRLMITFDNEAGYCLLLADIKELVKLKLTSYLDMEFLNYENQYRVHLYWRKGLKTRLSHWVGKYPQVNRTIGFDQPLIRQTVDLETNSLSKAIYNARVEFNCLGSPEKNLKSSKHESPQTPPEHANGKKKIKVKNSTFERESQTNLNKKKTKHELILGNEELRAKLKEKEEDMHKKMESLEVCRQSARNILFKLPQKLSPSNKLQYDKFFDRYQDQESDKFQIDCANSPASMQENNEVETQKTLQAPNEKNVVGEMAHNFVDPASNDKSWTSESSFITSQDEGMAPVTKNAPVIDQITSLRSDKDDEINPQETNCKPKEGLKS